MKTASLLAIAAAIAATATAYGSAPERYGPVMNPDTPDAAVMIAGRVWQIDYLECVAPWRAGAPNAVLFEDGSAVC